jgi:alpha-tubulin suppressor-like RCC1 family protein
MSTITRYGVDLECTEIPFDRPIKKISGDVASLLILSTDGCVFALGKSGPYFGIPEQQLFMDEPIQLNIQNATDIYHAEQKSLILTNDNTLYVMGIGSLMNLGFKESKHFDTPTAVPKENYEYEKILFVGTAYSFSVIVTSNKNLFLFGQK